MAEKWDRDKLERFVTSYWGEDAPAVMQQTDGWIARGDGVAVYRNNDLSSAEPGHPKIVSYGSARAQLESEEPPKQLPDIGGQINWRYQLEAVCGGPSKIDNEPEGCADV